MFRKMERKVTSFSTYFLIPFKVRDIPLVISFGLKFRRWRIVQVSSIKDPLEKLESTHTGCFERLSMSSSYNCLRLL